MEEFFPSEIARLVLGYLEESQCKKSWHAFVKESSNLSEYLYLCQKGKVYSTNVNGKTLLNILNEYCALKREAMKNDVECPKGDNYASALENHIAISKDTMEDIVKSAVDRAFQQYLPSICKERANNFADNVAITANEAEKSKMPSEDINNINGDVIAETSNDSDIELIDVDENAKITSSQLSIAEVLSLCDVDSKEKASFNSEENSVNDLSKDDCVCLLGTVKVENDRDATDPVVNIQNKNTDVANTPTLLKDCKSDILNVDLECDTETKSTVPVKSLRNSNIEVPNTEENSDLSLKPVNNVELGHLLNFKRDLDDESHSDHKIENDQVVLNSSFEMQNSDPKSSTPFCDNVKQNSPFDTLSVLIQGDNSLNTSNSSNTQSVPTITSNHFPNQCATAMPLSTVPTYILSNFPSSNCFMQNSNGPYIIINNPVNGMPGVSVNNISNNPVNGMPLSVPGVSVNNISNPVFTTTNLTSVNELPHTVPASAVNLPSIRPAITKDMKGVKIKELFINNPVQTLDHPKENEIVKRKNDEVFSERKKSNSLEEASKINKKPVSPQKSHKKKSTKKKSINKKSQKP